MPGIVHGEQDNAKEVEATQGEGSSMEVEAKLDNTQGMVSAKEVEAMDTKQGKVNTTEVEAMDSKQGEVVGTEVEAMAMDTKQGKVIATEVEATGTKEDKVNATEVEAKQGKVIGAEVEATDTKQGKVNTEVEATDIKQSEVAMEVEATDTKQGKVEATDTKQGEVNELEATETKLKQGEVIAMEVEITEGVTPRSLAQKLCDQLREKLRLVNESRNVFMQMVLAESNTTCPDQAARVARLEQTLTLLRMNETDLHKEMENLAGLQVEAIKSEQKDAKAQRTAHSAASS